MFRDVDRERTAAFVVTTVHGARNRRVTTASHEPVLAVRRELTDYIRTRLVADEGNGERER